MADLASLADAARLADEAAVGGALDVVIHNAGIGFGADRKRRDPSRVYVALHRGTFLAS